MNNVYQAEQILNEMFISIPKMDEFISEYPNVVEDRIGNENVHKNFLKFMEFYNQMGLKERSFTGYDFRFTGNGKYMTVHITDGLKHYTLMAVHVELDEPTHVTWPNTKENR